MGRALRGCEIWWYLVDVLMDKDLNVQGMMMMVVVMFNDVSTFS